VRRKFPDMAEGSKYEKRAADWAHSIMRMIPSYRGRLVTGSVIGVILVVIGLWWFVGPSTSTEKKDFVQAVGILLAGLGGLVGLYFTWKNSEQNRMTTQKTLELIEQGQITERFTRAIDQLGSTDNDGNPQLETRLGGIYALERVAKDSPRDYGPVMQVLMAYVRANAPISSREATESNPVADGASQRDIDTIQALSDIQEPSVDIQAILDVLIRRDERHVPEGYRVHLNLDRTDLRGARLDEADLQEISLTAADLRGADLRGAFLVTANLREADLRGADLSMGTDLRGAYLEGADFQLTLLQGADLRRATLVRANLRWANLPGADLRGAIGITEEQLQDTFGDDTTRLNDNEDWLVEEGLLEEDCLAKGDLRWPTLWSKDLAEQWNSAGFYWQKTVTDE
jgi:uncharacterized protein YjbI with pentapeptide repeats